MDIEQLWEKAQKKTEIVRGRAKGLMTFKATEVPYIFLGESSVNQGNTVIRRGNIVIERPMIVLPDNMPQFEGFEFEEDMDVDMDAVQMFFLMRGVKFPSMKYNNSVETLDLSEESLSRAIERARKELEKEENVNTALVTGPEDCWQFSILIYMAALVGRCAKSDITNLMNRLNG